MSEDDLERELDDREKELTALTCMQLEAQMRLQEHLGSRMNVRAFFDALEQIETMRYNRGAIDTTDAVLDSLKTVVPPEEAARIREVILRNCSEEGATDADYRQRIGFIEQLLKSVNLDLEGIPPPSGEMFAEPIIT